MPTAALAAQDAAPVTIAADPAAIAAFVTYLIVALAIGVYATRFSSAGVSEFFVGGRKMHRFVVALSAVVSGRSAWLLLVVSGKAFAGSFGLSQTTGLLLTAGIVRGYTVLGGFLAVSLTTWCRP